MIYRDTKNSACEEEIQKIAPNIQSFYSCVSIKIVILNGPKQNHWCCIIYNSFSKHKTVEQRCVILVQDLQSIPNKKVHKHTQVSMKLQRNVHNNTLKVTWQWEQS